MSWSGSILRAALISTAAAGLAWGEQFVLFEGVFVHTTATKGFSYPKMAPGVPSDWLSPVNYAEGRAYSEYELRSMASDRPISYQWCLFQGGTNHTCSQCVRFTRPGLYTVDEQVDKMWANFRVDYSRPFDRFMLVVKDEHGNPVDDRWGFAGGWAGSPDFSLYYPFEVRVRIVVVSKGATYNPHWETGGVKVSEVVLLKEAAAALEAGELGLALATAERELASSDPARAAEAARVAEAIRAHARTRSEELAAMKPADPAYAIKALAELARRLAPSPLAKELMAEAVAWQKDPAVAREMSARSILEAAERAASRIRTRGTVSDPKFAQRYAVELQTIAACALRLAREFPGTRSAARAQEIARGFGLELEPRASVDAAPAVANRPSPMRAEPGRNSPVSGPERPKGSMRPSPEGLDTWDARLSARIASEVASAREVPFHYARQRARVVSIDGKRTLTVSMGGVELTVPWAKLSLADRLSLALGVLREGAAPDHALAAFYMLAVGDEDRAQEHLHRSGDLAGAVRAAFE